MHSLTSIHSIYNAYDQRNVATLLFKSAVYTKYCEDEAATMTCTMLPRLIELRVIIALSPTSQVSDTPYL